MCSFLEQGTEYAVNLSDSGPHGRRLDGVYTEPDAKDFDKSTMGSLEVAYR